MSDYRTARLRAHLARMADLGLRVATDLQAQALAARNANTAVELAEAFVKVSDEVRRTIALEARLAREFPLSDAPRGHRRRVLPAAAEPEPVDPDAPKPVKH